MNSIIFVTSFLLVKYFFYFNSFIDSIIAFFLIFISQIILSVQLLGIANSLYFNYLIILNFVFLLIAILAIKILKIESKYGIILKSKAFFANNIDLNKTIILSLSFIIGFALVKIFVNLINPPFGWDCLNYHFTFPVEWMKNGNLDNPIVVSDDPFPTYYPMNGSLWFFWLMLPFKSAFLADLGQLPFFIIAFLAVFSIGRKLRLNNEYSLLAACLFVITPNFFKQLQIGYVDIMVGGIFLAALNFILALKEKLDLKTIIIFAISFGILIGIKTTVLPYSFFIFILFLYLVFWQKQISLIKKIGFIILFFLSIFIFGSFSYFRNLILTGNPFYPLEVKILGINLLKGVIDKATFTSRNEEGGYSFIKLLFHEGMGIQSLAIVLPAAIFAFPINILKNKNKDIFLNYFMLLPLLLYLTYRFILPIPNSRYLYPTLGIGMIVGFYLLNSFKIPISWIRTTSMLIILVSLFECARHLELGISFGISFLLLTVFLLCLKFKNLRAVLSRRIGRDSAPKGTPGFGSNALTIPSNHPEQSRGINPGGAPFSKSMVFLFILVFIFIFEWSFSNYRKNEYRRYIKNSRYWPDATQAWLWLNESTTGNNIAYVGKPVPYPLYGTGFKNNVYYVSVNSIDPIHLHDLKNSKYRWGLWKDDASLMHKSFEQPNNYRGDADYSIWLYNLKKRKTDFLFIYSLHHTKDVIFPLEEEWVKNHPEEFNLVFSNGTVKIYNLKE